MIGKVIKFMRKDNNLTQYELAKLLNIKQNTLSRYETENSDINFKTIEEIAKICGFEIYFKKDKKKFKAKDLKRKDI